MWSGVGHRDLSRERFLREPQEPLECFQGVGRGFLAGNAGVCNSPEESESWGTAAAECLASHKVEAAPWKSSLDVTDAPCTKDSGDRTPRYDWVCSRSPPLSASGRRGGGVKRPKVHAHAEWLELLAEWFPLFCRVKITPEPCR